MKDEVVMIGGDSLLAFLTATQIDDVMRWVSLALTILTTIVTLAFTVYKWYIKATEDGHIDADEIKELEDIFVKKEDKNNDE